jgi:hypothetical protein
MRMRRLLTHFTIRYRQLFTVLRAMKIRSLTYGMLKNPTSMEEILRRQNSTVILRQVPPVSLLGVSASNFQRALMDKTRMIRNHMGTHNISETVAVQGSP